tara:strand:+ start:172 stop:486 length:315 start_codon:yes stop_codon:yes gene_type:complete
MKSVIIKIIDKGIRKKAARLLISLANKVGSIHFIDVSDAKFAEKESLKFPKVAQIETPEYEGVALVDSQGELIGGQRGMVLNAPLNDACTATVTFVIGGIHTDN